MLDLPLPLVRATESVLVLSAACVLDALGPNGAYRVNLSGAPVEVVSGSDPSVDSAALGQLQGDHDGAIEAGLFAEHAHVSHAPRALLLRDLMQVCALRLLATRSNAR
jgi:hypothetical protein